MTKKDLLMDIIHQIGILQSRLDVIENLLHEQKESIRLCQEHKSEELRV